MTPEQWERAKELFETTRNHAPDERTAFLDDRCQDDPELRAAVQSMLQSDDSPAKFMEPPLEGAAVGLLTEGVLPAGLGQRVGAYRLTDVISSGGMGTVYRAVRADEALRKQAAIKIIRRGMDSADVVRRFRRERQTLAGLEHPSIARFLDAGATDDGLPYLVMEFVEGQPLDRYCDEWRLTTRQRLELFRQVCSAIHYAHQNLVVHRDLKPGNILVTEQGAPKVVDFGIAKLLDPEVDAQFGDPTVTTMRVMTPQYASPEQIRGEPTSTACDVYSLGVVLYELLTGHRPYQVKRQPRPELERIICDVEPDTPSSAISRIVEVAQSDGTTRRITPESVSLVREGRPDRLRRRLAGDVDTIVMTAMHKDPQRRYASVEQLSEDIRRHLEGQPVTAQPDTWSYRTGKFISRNKAVVITGVLVFLSLVGGVIGTTIGLLEARQARAEAATEAERARLAAETAERINEFLQETLTSADPAQGKKDITVREVLDKAARRVTTDLEQDPAIRAAVHANIAGAYCALGLYDKAKEQLEISLAIRRRLFDSKHAKIAVTLHNLGTCEWQRGRYDRAERLLTEAMHLRRALLGDQHEHVALTINALATVLQAKGSFARAGELLREALAITTAAKGEEHPSAVNIRSNLAVNAFDQGDYSAAEKTHRQILEIDRRIHGARHLSVASDLNNLGNVLLKMAAYDEAVTVFREALDLKRELLDPEHPSFARGLANLGSALRRQGELAAAEAPLREGLQLRRDALGAAHPDVATGANELGALLFDLGRYDDAEALFRETLQIRREALGDRHPRVATALCNIAEVFAKRRDFAEAARLRLEALAIEREAYGSKHPEVGNTLFLLAKTFRALGRHEQAVSAAREALAIREAILSEEHPQVDVSLTMLGLALLDMGDAVEAEGVLRRVVRIRRTVLPDGSWLIGQSESHQGMALTHLGRYSEAEQLLLGGHELISAEFGDRDEHTTGALGRVVQLYDAWGKPEEAARWRAKLPADDRAQDPAQPLTSQPAPAE